MDIKLVPVVGLLELPTNPLHNAVQGCAVAAVFKMNEPLFHRRIDVGVSGNDLAQFMESWKSFGQLQKPLLGVGLRVQFQLAYHQFHKAVAAHLG